MSSESEVRGLARDLRVAAHRVEERRAALGRYALVWWQGEAAERYQQRVAERSARLSALSAALAEVADLADGLADLLARGEPVS